MSEWIDLFAVCVFVATLISIAACSIVFCVTLVVNTLCDMLGLD